MPTTYDATAQRLEISKMHVDQRSYSAGDEKARAMHRSAVAEVAAACPSNIVDSINWLQLAIVGVHHLHAPSASNRSALPKSTINELRKIAAKFHSLALTLSDDVIATVGTPAKMRRRCEVILDELGGKVATVEFCPSPKRQTMLDRRRTDPYENHIPLSPAARDLAEFATAVAKGIVPTGLNRLHTQKAIARGEWTIEQVQIASYAIRLGRNQAKFLAERDRRQKSIQVLRDKQAAGKLGIEARKPVARPRKRGSLIGLAEKNFRPISTAETPNDQPPETSS